MSRYLSLAPFYDGLTMDVNYSEFADFYEQIFDLYHLKVKTILDIACGTGTLTWLLAERGYETVGVDASAEMLSVAASKASKVQVREEPLFINQSLQELDLYGASDAALCSLDGINYIAPDELVDVFRRVRCFVEPNGVFVFDINTPYKLRGLDGEMWIDEDDDVYCVWRTEFQPAENACFYGMDIFSRCGELWERTCEEHIEYAHTVPFLKDALEKAGFSNIHLYGDRTLLPPTDCEQRIFIAAQNVMQA